MDAGRQHALADRIHQAALRSYEEDAFDKEAAYAAVDALSMEDNAAFLAAVRTLIFRLEDRAADVIERKKP